MRLLDIGDLHYTLRKVIDQPITDFLRSIVLPEDILVFNGDTLNNFDIGVKNNQFFDFLALIKNKIFIILGNHDISKGRCGLSVLRPFIDRIVIIEDYEYYDINDNYRLHFKNYFKNAELKFDIKENTNNILFTHMDLDVNNPNIALKDLDLIISGHQHDFQRREKYLNLGAIRKVAKNEIKEKKYLTIDLDNKELNYQLHDFESVIDIKEIFAKDLRDVNIDKNTILKVLINSYQDEDDLMKKIQALEWYDKEKVEVEFINYIDKSFISEIESEVLENNGSLNLLKIFDDYLDTYVEKFKDAELDKDLLKSKFKYFYEKDFEQLKDLFNVYNIKFKNLEAKNFKLFKNLKLNFNDYKPGIISIEGYNKDELKNGNPSSNEAGKSNLRDMLNFTLVGDDKPLRWGEKSGYSKLNLDINGIDIILERKYTKAGNELRIWFDGVEKWDEETTTHKEELFYEKFKIKNSIPYILLSDTGLGKYFFSSKNSEKFRIFKEIFPIIDSVGGFIQSIKAVTDTKEKEYDKLKNDKDNLLQIRKNNTYWKTYFEVKEEFKNINIGKIQLKIDNIKLDENILNNKEGVEYIHDNLNQELTLCYNKIFLFNADVKSIFDEYDKNEKIVKELNQKKNNLISEKNKDNELKEEFEILNNKLTELGETEVIEDDLNMIKHKLLILYKFDKIESKYTRQELWDILHLDRTTELNLKMERDLLYGKIDEIKNRVLEVQDELNSLESIECPNCSFNIVDKKREDALKSTLLRLKQSGRLIKEEYDKVKIKYESEVNNNKDLIIFKEKIEEQLEDISINELKKYFENTYNYKVDIKYTLENIDNFIKIKEDQIIKNERRFNLNEQLDENLRKSLTVQVNIKELSEYFKKLESKLEKYDDTAYNNIIEELKDLNLTKADYIVNEIKIRKMLNYNIIKELNEDIEPLYNSLQYQSILEKELEVLNKELQWEIKLKDTFEYKYNKFINEFLTFKKDNDRIRKDLNIRFDNCEKEYKELRFLYDVMTAKRTFNFEKFFINTFFQKFSDIFNLMLKILFHRNVSLYITESNFYFKDGGEDELSFNIFSLGAKSKIQIALILTITILFVNYGINSDLQIIDEVFDVGLDEINLNKAMELIIQFFGEKKKNFIVSHKNIEEFVNQKIIIERERGESKII